MKLLIGMLLAALIVWVYAPALAGGFVYEDYKAHDACDGMRMVGRFVTVGSWCWQVDLGHAARTFHLVSLGLHLVVTALVGALAWTVTRSDGAAFIAAAFFGLNAVHVESVAYLTSRGELLAALGVVGACLAAWHRWWLLTSTLLLVGWWSKETASVAAMLVPLVLWYQTRRRWWLVAAGAGAVALAVAILSSTAIWWTYEGMPTRSAWALLQATGITRVWVLAVLPFGHTVDYDYTRVPMAVQVYACVTLFAGIIWGILQRQRLLHLGLAWTVLAVLPRLIVPTPRSVFNEHQFYLPLVGMALLLAGVLVEERA